jgi:hypothetical protein
MTDWNAVFGSSGFWMSFQEWGNPDHTVEQLLQGDSLLRIPLVQDYSLLIDCKFLGSETFSLAHPTLSAPLELGWFGGNFALPAFRWDEVYLLEQRLEARWSAPFSYAYFPLLLNPLALITEADDRERISAKIWADWSKASIFSEQDLAAYYRRPYGSILPAVPEARWRRDPALGWVCENWYSLRHPENKDLPFEALARFFSAVAES